MSPLEEAAGYALEPVTDVITAITDSINNSETVQAVQQAASATQETVRETTKSVIKDTAHAIDNTAKAVLPDVVYQKAKETTEAVGIVVQQVNEARQNPLVQDVAKTITAPVATVTTVATAVSTSASFAQFALYFQFFISQPLLFLGGRKRITKWGKVYNSLTGLPVDLAVVRLYDSVNNRLLQTKITDQEGRYQFTVGPGHYKLVVRKEGLDYPSSLAGQDYMGGEIIITGDRAVIDKHIPLDPSVALSQSSSVQLLAINAKRNLKRLLVTSSAFIMLGSFVIRPTWGMFWLLVFQLLLQHITMSLQRKSSLQQFGSVEDAVKSLFIPKAVVRIMEPTYGRMLEFQVTDSLGRYGFLVGEKAKQYQLLVEKDGYETLMTPVKELAKGQSVVVDRLVVKPIKS
ncbi:MAG: carboxypeptidase-like regulatory domain-containing protein [bacterium]